MVVPYLLQVHERQMQSDFLLILLRQALAAATPAAPAPKVICMSATIDADLFARYLGPG